MYDVSRSDVRLSQLQAILNTDLYTSYGRLNNGTFKIGYMINFYFVYMNVQM